MRTILCNITAERQETISQVVSPSVFKLSVADSSTIPVGSTVSNVTSGTNSSVKGILSNGDIEVFDSTFSPNAGDTIIISSIFRYSNLETTIDQNGNTLVYQGRLSVGSINESFGTFVDKKQVISNANVSLLNLDGKLGDIFHSYKLHTGASVELLYGDTNSYIDFKKYFYGITASGSNFTYDDSIFSFSIKDFRSTMLDSLVPPTLFDPNLFSKYRAFNVSSTVAYVTVDLTPADWYVGLQVKTNTGTATISEINNSQLGLTNYSNTIGKDQRLESIFLATSATTTSAATPIAAGISILGGTGHYIGIFDDKTPITKPVYTNPTGGSGLAIINTTYYAASIFAGTGYASNSNLYQTFKTTEAGVLSSLSIQLIKSTPTLRLLLTINAPGVYIVLVLPNPNASNNVTIDLEHNNIVLQPNTQVTFNITSGDQTSYTGLGLVAATYFDVVQGDTSLTYKRRRATGGSTTTTHTIDLGTEKVTSGPDVTGNIFFTRSLSTDLVGTNNCKISVQLLTANGTSVSYTDIINSGLTVPTEINGLPITTAKFYITLKPSTSALEAVELYSLFVSYNTNVVSGTTSDMGNKPIPLLYGDFSDTAVPAILINTIQDRAFGSNYSFSPNGTSTNSLRYNKLVPGSTKVMGVGDSIRYTADSGAEEIYAKITQIVPDVNPDTGTVYFEDFNIIPDSFKPITIEREVNTYKVCENQLTSIVEYLYLPSSGTILLPLPGSVSFAENLAAGEFTLTGSNLADKIYVKCTGKSDANAILIESPEAIITELSSLIGFPITTQIIGNTNNVKLRRYIDTEVKFSEFLASIEASANIYTHMSVDNILTIKRFASTNAYTRTYREHNIIQDTFQESYDPDNVYADGSILSYNYSPFDSVNIKTNNLGSSATTNLLESSWLYRDVDAELVNSQLFSVINKIPELIQVTVAADDVLSITLGENIRIIHNGAEHIIFVYTYSKNADKNTIDIIGWNLANGYNIDFPVPEFAEFPAALQQGPYGYTPWLLNDKTITNSLGNYDVNVVTSEGFRVAPTGSVVPKTAGVNSIEASNSVLIFKPALGTRLQISLFLTLIGTIGYTFGYCSEAQIGAITGDRAVDAFTNILTDATPGQGNTWLNPTAVGTEYILIYFNDGIIVDNLTTYDLVDNNIADDRYNYWNPNWGFKQKQYYLARYKIQGLPPSGLCVSLDGSIVDNIEAFKGK